MTPPSQTYFNQQPFLPASSHPSHLLSCSNSNPSHAPSTLAIPMPPTNGEHNPPHPSSSVNPSFFPTEATFYSSSFENVFTPLTAPWAEHEFYGAISSWPNDPTLNLPDSFPLSHSLCYTNEANEYFTSSNTLMQRPHTHSHFPPLHPYPNSSHHLPFHTTSTLLLPTPPDSSSPPLSLPESHTHPAHLSFPNTTVLPTETTATTEMDATRPLASTISTYLPISSSCILAHPSFPASLTTPPSSLSSSSSSRSSSSSSSSSSPSSSSSSSAAAATTFPNSNSESASSSPLLPLPTATAISTPTTATNSFSSSSSSSSLSSSATCNMSNYVITSTPRSIPSTTISTAHFPTPTSLHCFPLSNSPSWSTTAPTPTPSIHELDPVSLPFQPTPPVPAIPTSLVDSHSTFHEYPSLLTPQPTVAAETAAAATTTTTAFPMLLDFAPISFKDTVQQPQDLPGSFSTIMSSLSSTSHTACPSPNSSLLSPNNPIPCSTTPSISPAVHVDTTSTNQYSPPSPPPPPSSSSSSNWMHPFCPSSDAYSFNPNLSSFPVEMPYHTWLRTKKDSLTRGTKPLVRSRRHSAPASSSFICVVCDKEFARAFNLKSHMKTHTDERPFTCSMCHKGFARKHDCVRHMRVHTKERPYRCHGCQKSFARHDALARHIRVDTSCVCHHHFLETQQQYPASHHHHHHHHHSEEEEELQPEGCAAKKQGRTLGHHLRLHTS